MKKKLYFLSALLFVFLFFDWFVSDQLRALKIDSNILYSIDDIFRFCYLKASFYHPVIYLNPNLKILSMAISRLFFELLPIGMTALRVMSSVFSVVTIFFLYKVTKIVNPEKKLPLLPVLFTLTSGVYFLVSISTLAESMFICFLILAIYFFYSEKFLFSTIIVSLLPTIRQEGVLFIAVWAILLIWQKRYWHLLILFVPAVLWSLANSLLLQHSLIYTMLYFKHLSANTPTSVLILPCELNKNIILFSLPALALFITGLFCERKNKKYLLIFLCVSFHLGFLILSSSIKLFKTGYLSYVIRLIAPSVPLISIYMGSGFEFFTQRLIRRRNGMILVMALAVLISVGLMFFKIQAFQKVSVVQEDSVTEEQIVALGRASLWLDDYLRINRIDNLYVLGDVATNRFIRRVWMGVSGRIRYYAIAERGTLIDMFTFKRIPLLDGRAVFICLSDDNFQYLNSFHKEFIKAFPEIPLEFYLLEPRNLNQGKI